MANDGFAQITLTPILLARRPSAPPAQSDAVAFSRLGDNHLRRVGPTLAANFYSIQIATFYSIQMDDLAELLPTRQTRNPLLKRELQCYNRAPRRQCSPATVHKSQPSQSPTQANRESTVYYK
jgi:hypothetical protein